MMSRARAKLLEPEGASAPVAGSGSVQVDLEQPRPMALHFSHSVLHQLASVEHPRARSERSRYGRDARRSPADICRPAGSAGVPITFSDEAQSSRSVIVSVVVIVPDLGVDVPPHVAPGQPIPADVPGMVFLPCPALRGPAIQTERPGIEAGSYHPPRGALRYRPTGCDTGLHPRQGASLRDRAVMERGLLPNPSRL